MISFGLLCHIDRRRCSTNPVLTVAGATCCSATAQQRSAAERTPEAAAGLFPLLCSAAKGEPVAAGSCPSAGRYPAALNTDVPCLQVAIECQQSEPKTALGCSHQIFSHPFCLYTPVNASGTEARGADIVFAAAAWLPDGGVPISRDPLAGVNSVLRSTDAVAMAVLRIEVLQQGHAYKSAQNTRGVKQHTYSID